MSPRSVQQTASAVESATIQASRLPDLIALAGEESSEKRRLLLRELTDHFFGAAEQNANENALYGDVLARLCDDMEVVVRAELAARFAPAPNAPHSLIRRFAHDAVEVADGVLCWKCGLTRIVFQVFGNLMPPNSRDTPVFGMTRPTR